MPFGYRANSESIAATASGTVATFADNTIPQGGFENLFVETTGTNNSLDSHINGVRVKLEGVPTVDLTGVQVRALQEAFELDNAPDAAGQLAFTIPMGLPYNVSGPWPFTAHKGGIPFGVKTSVELNGDGSTAAGTALIGWQSLLEAPEYMLKCVQQQTGAGASGTSQRTQINYGANDVIGFVYPNPANGFTRLRIVAMLPNGTEFQVFHGDNSLTKQMQRYRNPLTITNPFVVMLDRAYKFPSGSFLEQDTGSGNATTDVFAAVQLVDVRPAQTPAQ